MRKIKLFSLGSSCMVLFLYRKSDTQILYVQNNVKICIKSNCMKFHIPSTFPSRETGFFFRAVNMHRFRINVVSVHSRNTGSKRAGQGKEHKFGHRSDNSLPETHAVFAVEASPSCKTNLCSFWC